LYLISLFSNETRAMLVLETVLEEYKAVSVRDRMLVA
jgi:hypothetical protein